MISHKSSLIPQQLDMVYAVKKSSFVNVYVGGGKTGGLGGKFGGGRDGGSGGGKGGSGQKYPHCSHTLKQQSDCCGKFPHEPHC
jgi:hypothetical protein